MFVSDRSNIGHEMVANWYSHTAPHFLSPSIVLVLTHTLNTPHVVQYVFSYCHLLDTNSLYWACLGMGGFIFS